MIYQQVGTTSSKASPPDISQESRLHFGFDIFGKNGGNQESENDYTVKKIWEILIQNRSRSLWSTFPAHSIKWWAWNLLLKWTYPNGSSVYMSFAITAWN